MGNELAHIYDLRERLAAASGTTVTATLPGRATADECEHMLPIGMCRECTGKLRAGGRCSSCGKAVAWVVTETDKRMPLDPEPVGESFGNVIIRRRVGRDLVARVLKKDEHPEEGTHIYVSHFATCTHPERHRRPR